MKPNTETMSLKQVLELRETRRELTRKMRAGLLNFRISSNINHKCEYCGTRPEVWSQDGQKHFEGVSFIMYQDERICRTCFELHWTTMQRHYRGLFMVGGGSPHPYTPCSQKEYDGW